MQERMPGGPGPDPFAAQKMDVRSVGGTANARFLETLGMHTNLFMGLKEPQRKLIEANGWQPIVVGEGQAVRAVGYVARVPGETQTDLIILNNHQVFATQPRDDAKDQYENRMTNPVYFPRLPVDADGRVPTESSDLLMRAFEKQGAQILLSSDNPYHGDSLYEYMRITLHMDTTVISGREDNYTMRRQTYLGDAQGQHTLFSLEKNAEQLLGGLPSRIEQSNQDQLGRAIAVPSGKGTKTIGYIYEVGGDNQVVVLNNGLILVGEQLPTPEENKNTAFKKNVEPLVIDGVTSSDTMITDEVSRHIVHSLVEQHGLYILHTNTNTEGARKVQPYATSVMTWIDQQVAERTFQVQRDYDPVMDYVGEILANVTPAETEEVGIDPDQLGEN